MSGYLKIADAEHVEKILYKDVFEELIELKRRREDLLQQINNQSKLFNGAHSVIELSQRLSNVESQIKPLVILANRLEAYVDIVED